eukprot:CAMPEP_0185189428 /NCGR_PEP_ID=MMETSP1140-20130426/6029_1 /TAXON_ID=298111 /ORGANISM="Pavlova sp., Strain CCMP459" /LENGTH=95 /DNA_ID=CAMNT_0027755989 /DNA_START=638 /DNA_END=921 /DNA_ORIENTATION=-
MISRTTELEGSKASWCGGTNVQSSCWRNRSLCCGGWGWGAGLLPARVRKEAACGRRAAKRGARGRARARTLRSMAWNSKRGRSKDAAAGRRSGER